MLAAFSGIDWLITIVLLAGATVPGFLVRHYVKHQSEFLVAGRTLPVFLAAATLTATEMGLVTVVYMAEQGFVAGFSAFVIGVIAMVTTVTIGLTGFMVAGLRASGVTTFAEYYERRYGRRVRLLGGLILATAGILNYGVFLRVEADFVRVLAGMPDMQLVSSTGWTVDVPAVQLVMFVLVLVVLSYTLLGGMVSVVITDYLQFVLITLGMAITTWFVLTNDAIGGPAGLVRAVTTERPGYGMNPFTTTPKADGTGVLGLGVVFVVWQSLLWMATSCWQTQAFRTAAVDSPRTARFMWTLTGVNYFGRAIIPMLWGVAAMAWLAASGAGAPAVDSKTAMPTYLAAILPRGAAGLLMGGMLAALMSTHSSYLLAWSGVITEDLITPIGRWLGLTMADRTRLWITRSFILLLGAYLIVFGLWFEVRQTVWGYLALTGTMYFAGAATLLAFGLYWKRANVGGALAGLICGAFAPLVSIILHMAALAFARAAAGAGTEPGGIAEMIINADKGLTEAWVGLVSYPLAIAGMIVGSRLFERRRRASGGDATTAPASRLPSAPASEPTP